MKVQDILTDESTWVKHYSAVDGDRAGMSERLRTGTCEWCGEPNVTIIFNDDLPDWTEGVACEKCEDFFLADAERARRIGRRKTEGQEMSDGLMPDYWGKDPAEDWQRWLKADNARIKWANEVNRLTVENGKLHSDLALAYSELREFKAAASLAEPAPPPSTKDER